MKQLQFNFLLILILFLGFCTKNPIGNYNLEKNHAGLGLDSVTIVNVTHNSISVSSNSTADGGSPIIERGFCWNTNGNPTINDSFIKSIGTSLGRFSNTISGLWGDSDYFIKAYVKTEKGIFYGEQIEVLTKMPVLANVRIVSSVVLDPFSTQVTVSVEDNGGRPIQEYGAVIAQSPNPTILNSISEKESNEIVEIGDKKKQTSDNQNAKRSKEIKAETHVLQELRVKMLEQNKRKKNTRKDLSKNNTLDESEIINFNNLNPNSNYYIRAYAKNEVGVSYGENYEINTPGIVQTKVVFDIESYYAKSGGDIPDIEGVEVSTRGIVWNTNPNPTTSDNKTIDGNGFGSYESLLTNLNEKDTYFVRAYVIIRNETFYGNEISFTTKEAYYELKTGLVINITATTAKAFGEIITNAGETVTERGIVIAQIPNPTTLDAKYISDVTEGGFIIDLTNLIRDTKYYIRSYLTNRYGTFYGNEVEFKTTNKYINSIGMELNFIEPGSFFMGSSSGEIDESPVHKVTLSKGFYMGRFEVTQEEWVEIMGDNSSGFTGIYLPVERVSWNDTQAFINKLNEREGESKYRLPTEAEWEYCAHAGAAENGEGTSWYFGSNENMLGVYIWFSLNSSNKTIPVGYKVANSFGLYDMLGNVSEWTHDWYGSYSSNDQIDPLGSEFGTNKVYRGGSWSDSAYDTRTARRKFNSPGFKVLKVGFRLVRDE